MKNMTFPRSSDTPFSIYKKLKHDEQIRNAKWKWFAWGCLGCLIAAIAALVWALSLPKTVPLVITVSDWGEAKYVGKISSMSYSGIKVPQIAVEYQIRKFVDHAYAIPTDSAILKRSLNDCYSSLTRDGANKFTLMLKDDNPLQRFGQVIRTVEVESILKLTNDSYQVDFYVTETDSGGKPKSRTRMRGVLTVAFLEPEPDEQKVNPLGIYFSNFDFTTVAVTKTGGQK